ncbi:hypothetical protein AVEN_201337-1 [Araneus ventricosus]|uniref:Peptidase A2 domain-containing protein n=1 Tax=Araneus ventricosus TaxID=182803 RepID=A0A4Y2JPU6_ARAVE|nr:hypothetical protein AVEN_201337-1 [Araneus ventricosus]
MFTDRLEVNIVTLALNEAIKGRNIISMDHAVTINLNLVIIVILINIKAHVAEVFGKLRPAVDSTAGSADDELKDCNKYRLFVTDRQTSLRFLVDSGADISIRPATPNLKICNSFKLYAANRTVFQNFNSGFRPASVIPISFCNR